MKKSLFIISIALNFIFGGFFIVHYIIYKNSKTKKSKVINHQEYRYKYFDILPVDSNTVVFAGDSHIEYFQVNEIFNSLKCKNRGVNGIRTTDLLKNIRILLKGNPNKIFIEMGTNDLFVQRPIDSIIVTYQDIINIIKTKSAKTKIYILSVIANKYDYRECNRLNERIKLLQGITYINLSPYFFDNGLKKQYDSGDGIHLNGEGYIKFHDIIVNYVNE